LFKKGKQMRPLITTSGKQCCGNGTATPTFCLSGNGIVMNSGLKWNTKVKKVKKIKKEMTTFWETMLCLQH
jgi:hypothetical protein